MQSLKLILLFSIFVSNFAYSKVQDKCLKVNEDGKDYKMKLSPNGKSRYRMSLITSDLTQDFFCTGTDILECSADDDAGTFKVEIKKSLIEIGHITFGEPDGKVQNFNWTKAPRTFELRPCTSP